MSVDHSALSAPVVVTRWRRYGHDRAYLKIGEDELGYRDLATGEIHAKRAELADTVAMATADLWERARVAAYVPRHGRPEGDAPGQRPVEPARAAPPVDLLPDRDLALNLPGQGVRQVAIELRDAAPVRTLLARIVGAKTDERANRIGADGEVAVARRLATLGPAWRVLHSVPVGDRGSDIDHVVIGPGGVFTVNAKNHPQASVWVNGDTVKVNGYGQPYVRNSRYEASRAARLLSVAAGFDVEVRAIIAIMGAHRGFTVRDQPRDGTVSVVMRKQIDAHLRSVPAVLGSPSIERIFAVARHLATWQPKTVRWENWQA